MQKGGRYQGCLQAFLRGLDQDRDLDEGARPLLHVERASRIRPDLPIQLGNWPPRRCPRQASRHGQGREEAWARSSTSSVSRSAEPVVSTPPPPTVPTMSPTPTVS